MNPSASSAANHSAIGDIPAEAIALAEQSVRAILARAVMHDASHDAVVVFDLRCELAQALAAVYRQALPLARFIDFDAADNASVMAAFESLAPHDLVVLIQSTGFRLDAYRLRVELFKRSLKVIEHVHLSRMPGMEALYYLDSLAYDPDYYCGVGRALKARIDRVQKAVVESGGERLVFGSALEEAKLNIGDYSGMKNVGGQFPIGEVFTEARDLEAVNGRVRIGVFGDTSFAANRPAQPITLVVERGRVVRALDSTQAFDEVMAKIRADEGEIWLRELGFGMNRAFSVERFVSDVGTYERMCGIHLSLGAKHGVYGKPLIRRKEARYHVDVFAITEAVYLDEECVFRDGAWIVR
jgi:aminopeptidase